jgi:Fe-S-cluster-containing dehydrogenase component
MRMRRQHCKSEVVVRKGKSEVVLIERKGIVGVEGEDCAGYSKCELVCALGE